MLATSRLNLSHRRGQPLVPAGCAALGGDVDPVGDRARSLSYRVTPHAAGDGANGQQVPASGNTCAQQADASTVARMTVETLRHCVPAAVPGVMFLSGGQSEEEATGNLNAMNQKYGPNPWALSYSYGRALQAGALKSWVGKAENESAAQDVLLERSRANSAACAGKAA